MGSLVRSIKILVHIRISKTEIIGNWQKWSSLTIWLSKKRPLTVLGLIGPGKFNLGKFGHGKFGVKDYANII